MPSGHHEVANLRSAPGELSFTARIGDRAQEVWMRTETDVVPNPEAALAACLMPAMRYGGRLEMSEPVSPRVLRSQREFQAVQAAWSLDWTFGEEPLREVEVAAATREPEPTENSGRVAAFFSGGVDSWATVLGNPDVTDLIFVRGFDLSLTASHQEGLLDEVEARLRSTAEELGMPLHVIETNLRELSDPLLRWDCFYGGAVVAVAHFFAPLFERVLIAGDSDYEVQQKFGANWMVDQLWSSERLEIVDDGGRFSRLERTAQIAGHPLVRRTLRVCWENPGGAYNCGSCRKCLMTMSTLEALGTRHTVTSFPPELDLEAVAALELNHPVYLNLWQDVLDAARAAGRADLERALERALLRGKRILGLPDDYRRRRRPGPPATVRVAVVIPAWRQAQYLAGAVRSALDQQVLCGVGVVVVNDGCPKPETDRIGQALHDAHPDRVAYLHQPNQGVSAARNAGIELALQRWPHVEYVFPLDADNELSPHTLAKLRDRLDERPEAAWASPKLEFFGGEEGGWQVPGPYLPYRQLFMNQCDTGSLIRREVFDAGVGYDETIKFGFEDWEFFLRASLNGFHGLQAGRCGFRYRRRPESMLQGAQQRAELLEAEVRSRHAAAFEPGALTRREHAEAPRFALILCDRDEVQLTAACDLEPRVLSLADYARSVAAAREGLHIPAVTVFTGSAALARLGNDGLATALFQLQAELREEQLAGLRIAGDPVGTLAAIAVRANGLNLLQGGALPHPGAVVEAEAKRGGPVDPLPEAAAAAARLLGIAIGEAGRLPLESHTTFLEYRHLEQMRTTFPWSSGEAATISASAPA
jgi:glycosyltransferase involved in cell wall biosynthesis